MLKWSCHCGKRDHRGCAEARTRRARPHCERAPREHRRVRRRRTQPRLGSRNSAPSQDRIGRCHLSERQLASSRVPSADRSRTAPSVMSSLDSYTIAYRKESVVARLARSDGGVAVDLAEGATNCQIVWSGSTTLWFSRREGRAFRWIEMDVETRKPTGRTAPGNTGCYDQPDPNPPASAAVRVVQTVDSDIRV